jgi:hypothetical protein
MTVINNINVHREEAERHADWADALLSELAGGTSGSGPYAPSLITRATAAQAHAQMAMWHDARAREATRR